MEEPIVLLKLIKMNFRDLDSAAKQLYYRTVEIVRKLRPDIIIGDSKSVYISFHEEISKKHLAVIKRFVYQMDPNSLRDDVYRIDMKILPNSGLKLSLMTNKVYYVIVFN